MNIFYEQFGWGSENILTGTLSHRTTKRTRRARVKMVKGRGLSTRSYLTSIFLKRRV